MQYPNTRNLNKCINDPLFISSISTFILVVVAFLFTGSEQTVSYFIFIIAIASIYFTYLRHLRGELNTTLLLTPLLIILTAFFLYSSTTQSNSLTTLDYKVFSLCFALSTLLHALYTQSFIKLDTAIVSILFLSTLLSHSIPALSTDFNPHGGKYLAALDPYFYYRHAETVFDTGFLPEEETMIYPGNPPNFSRYRFMVSLFMGSLASILAPIGITLLDVAIIYPALFSAFIVVVFYLLLKELFYSNQPHNQLIAFFGAFMLIWNPSFAAKAIAANCEDDALGMFLLISTFFLFMASVNRKKLSYSVLAGVSLLTLTVTWTGYVLAIAILGAFCILYSIIQFIHRLECVSHLKYLLIPAGMSMLYPLILHAPNTLPTFAMPPTLIMIALGGALVTAYTLEMVRAAKINKRNNHRLTPVIGSTLLILSFIYILYTGPTILINSISSIVLGTKTAGIIGMTTAEQNVMCSSINIDCVNALRNYFGVSIYLGLLMIPFLLYFAFFRNSTGSLFILCWSLPLLWGAINKLMYQFVASPSVVALGATAGLLIPLTMKALKSPASVTLTLIILGVLFTSSIQSVNTIPLFGLFGGASPMHMGVSRDRIFWDDTFTWLSNQSNDTMVLCWWDYGHWISAVAKKRCILDNTKHDSSMVQDIARFHVLITNESEAFAIAKKYNATHIIIDYTMIGKSGAPHFIATSNLTSSNLSDPNREGSFAGYSSCVFQPSLSAIEPVIKMSDDGLFSKSSTLVYACNNGLRIVFEIVDGEYSVDTIYVVANNQLRPWKAWQEYTGASLLGIQSFNDVIQSALQSSTLPSNSIYAFDTFRTLIYVPIVTDANRGTTYDFNKVMMTKLYLGDYLSEYQAAGLASSSIESSKHFKLVEDFRGNTQDSSFWGYVRVYEVIY